MPSAIIWLSSPATEFRMVGLRADMKWQGRENRRESGGFIPIPGVWVNIYSRYRWVVSLWSNIDDDTAYWERVIGENSSVLSGGSPLPTTRFLSQTRTRRGNPSGEWGFVGNAGEGGGVKFYLPLRRTVDNRLCTRWVRRDFALRSEPVSLGRKKQNGYRKNPESR